MPKFIVTVKREALVKYYSSEIEAATREEAAKKAEDAWNDGDDAITFERDSSDLIEYEDIVEINCDPEYGDVEQLDDEPIGAAMPDGTRLEQWDERLRAAGGIPIYGDN